MASYAEEKNRSIVESESKAALGLLFVLCSSITLSSRGSFYKFQPACKRFLPVIKFILDYYADLDSEKTTKYYEWTGRNRIVQVYTGYMNPELVEDEETRKIFESLASSRSENCQNFLNSLKTEIDEGQWQYNKTVTVRKTDVKWYFGLLSNNAKRQIVIDLWKNVEAVRQSMPKKTKE